MSDNNKCKNCSDAKGLERLAISRGMRCAEYAKIIDKKNIVIKAAKEQREYHKLLSYGEDNCMCIICQSVRKYEDK